ncbi:hypothetical protein BOTCAL_0327g00080 [Botryotinia calthae]|uniref:C2H2-type domain-containing protein n=1 Tax=Botryotinia calthae TaxID=38488 RepID=A0A4Y8CTF1_9HELO|nr:hypothetical protein BOTCAL_0327g00080 [Botryotinia calthae]
MVGNISKQFAPTPFVNHGEIAGQIATTSLFSPSPQKLSQATDGLTRHFKNIHTQNFQVVCPVYGCHRTTKPFTREDKFMEHFRKHDSSRSYRCLIESCQSAPFDIPGLIDHLAMKHYMDHKTQNNLGFTTRKVLKINSIPFWLGLLSSNGGDICPLAPIGCTYRITADDGENFHKFAMAVHIFTHEISDRLHIREILRNFVAGDTVVSLYLDDGAKNCMLCSFQANGYFCHESLLDHMVKDHSEEERSSVLGELFQVIEWFLNFSGYPKARVERLNFISLVNECRVAGFESSPYFKSFFGRV